MTTVPTSVGAACPPLCDVRLGTHILHLRTFYFRIFSPAAYPSRHQCGSRLPGSTWSKPSGGLGSGRLLHSASASFTVGHRHKVPVQGEVRGLEWSVEAGAASQRGVECLE